MSNLINSWANFVMQLALQDPSAYVQIRKIFRDVTFSVDYDMWDEIPLTMDRLGYSKGPSKINQLKRNYLSVEELEKARDSLIGRMNKEQSCITARFGNKEKDSRSQGFCMQTITLNYLKKPLGGDNLVVELYYRSTEVGQKFLADLIFLDQVVFPILLKGLPDPSKIVFKFSTVYLSSMFLPILLQHVDAKSAISDIKLSDPKWFTRCVRVAISHWMKSECHYNYRTRAKMHEVFRKFVYPSLSKSDKADIRRLVKK